MFCRERRQMACNQELVLLLCMNTAMSTYLCQSDEVCSSLILKICLSGAWFLSSKPMVCACFNVQCLSSTSNRFASSLISSDVNAVPKSHMILEGMYERLKKLRQGLVLRCLRRLS